MDKVEISPSEINTDLGAALDECLRVIALSDGEKTIVVFTDAQARPGPASRYRGRSFESILNAVTLPPNTRVLLRVYGSEPLNVKRPGFLVLRGSPDWTALLELAPKKPAPPPVPRPPAWKKWRFFMAAAALCVIAISVTLWRRVAHADKSADLLDPAPMPAETPARIKPRKITRYHVEAGAHSIQLEPGIRPFAIVGDTPLADLPLDSAEGAWVHLELAGEAEPEALTIHNGGPSPVFVGSRRVAPRAAFQLPSQPIEARLGRELLCIYPETVVLEGEPS